MRSLGTDDIAISTRPFDSRPSAFFPFRGGQKCPALRDDALLFAQWHGEDIPRLLWQLRAYNRMGRCQLLLPFRGTKNIPAFDRHPVCPCEIWRGEEAFPLEEFGVAFLPCAEGDHSAVTRLEVYEREHLSADCLVAHPKDEIRAPLHGLGDVRHPEKQAANPLDVHRMSIGSPTFNGYVAGLLDCPSKAGWKSEYFEDRSIQKTFGKESREERELSGVFARGIASLGIASIESTFNNLRNGFGRAA
jgi:hypothetical protein